MVLYPPSPGLFADPPFFDGYILADEPGLECDGGGARPQLFEFKYLRFDLHSPLPTLQGFYGHETDGSEPPCRRSSGYQEHSHDDIGSLVASRPQLFSVSALLRIPNHVRF